MDKQVKLEIGFTRNKVEIEDQIIAPKQAAYMLNVSYKTIMRKIQDRTIPAYKVGRHYKISKELLLQKLQY